MTTHSTDTVPVGTGAVGWKNWVHPVDLAIAAALAVWATIEALMVPSANPVQQLLFALAVTLPIAFRRRLPALVILVISLAFLAHAWTAGADATFNPFPSLLVATYGVAERVRRSWLAALLGTAPIGAMLGAHALGFFGTPGIEDAGVAFLVFFVGATWTAGRIVRARALAAERERAGSRQQAEHAVAAERARIARELHDVVAHALSIVALQAAASERFLDKDLDRARHHLRLTRNTAQDALDEMRNLLDVLHDDGALYTPQPGLSGIEALVSETAAAGHVCTVRVDDADDVPDGIGLAVYRVVQEALTNVRKHAPGAAVEVHVAVHRSPRRIEATVDNTAPPATAGRGSGGSLGIPGMRERARVYGGSLDAGARADGGWRVRLVLPVREHA